MVRAVSRTVVRLVQASEYGWASAAVVCFWLQFHTSWQTVCVKRSADSGCEIRRVKGAGRTKQHKTSPRCLLSTYKQKKGIYRWVIWRIFRRSLLWALLLVENGWCWASLSSQPKPFHSFSGGKHPKYPPSPMDGDGWMDKISNNLNIYLVFKYCSKWFTWTNSFNPHPPPEKIPRGKCYYDAYFTG